MELPQGYNCAMLVCQSCLPSQSVDKEFYYHLRRYGPCEDIISIPEGLADHVERVNQARREQLHNMHTDKDMPLSYIDLPTQAFTCYTGCLDAEYDILRGTLGAPQSFHNQQVTPFKLLVIHLLKEKKRKKKIELATLLTIKINLNS